MDNYMRKFYIENYNGEELKKINKMNKILTNAYQEIINKKKENIYREKKQKEQIKKLTIEELFNKYDDMYNLSSFINKQKILDIIIKSNGDEDKIQEEIEKII